MMDELAVPINQRRAAPKKRRLKRMMGGELGQGGAGRGGGLVLRDGSRPGGPPKHVRLPALGCATGTKLPAQRVGMHPSAGPPPPPHPSHAG